MSQAAQNTGKAFTKTTCEVPTVGFSIIDADKSVTKTPSILDIVNNSSGHTLYFADEMMGGQPWDKLAKHWNALK